MGDRPNDSERRQSQRRSAFSLVVILACAALAVFHALALPIHIPIILVLIAAVLAGVVVYFGAWLLLLILIVALFVTGFIILLDFL